VEPRKEVSEGLKKSPPPKKKIKMRHEPIICIRVGNGIKIKKEQNKTLPKCCRVIKLGNDSYKSKFHPRRNYKQIKIWGGGGVLATTLFRISFSSLLRTWRIKRYITIILPPVLYV
jgi:hypothetical protein